MASFGTSATLLRRVGLSRAACAAKYPQVADAAGDTVCVEALQEQLGGPS
jgi:hypothetical protein